MQTNVNTSIVGLMWYCMGDTANFSCIDPCLKGGGTDDVMGRRGSDI